jgi:hypothetical protein
MLEVYIELLTIVTEYQKPQPVSLKVIKFTNTSWAIWFSSYKGNQHGLHLPLVSWNTKPCNYGASSHLMCNGYQPKKSCCLCRPPFTTGTVWQGHHYRLQFLACDLELANTLEFHWFPCEIFLGGYSISKDVKQESPTAWCMHSECNNVAHHRLVKINISSLHSTPTWIGRQHILARY